MLLFDSVLHAVHYRLSDKQYERLCHPKMLFYAQLSPQIVSGQSFQNRDHRRKDPPTSEAECRPSITDQTRPLKSLFIP